MSSCISPNILGKPLLVFCQWSSLMQGTCSSIPILFLFLSFFFGHRKTSFAVLGYIANLILRGETFVYSFAPGHLFTRVHLHSFSHSNFTVFPAGDTWWPHLLCYISKWPYLRIRWEMAFLCSESFVILCTTQETKYFKADLSPSWSKTAMITTSYILVGLMLLIGHCISSITALERCVHVLWTKVNITWSPQIPEQIAKGFSWLLIQWLRIPCCQKNTEKFQSTIDVLAISMVVIGFLPLGHAARESWKKMSSCSPSWYA